MPAPAAPLPTVRRLEQLFTEVTAKPLWAPPNFWRYLRLCSRVRLRFARLEAMTMVPPPGKVNHCAACLDNCCIGKHASVPLRLRDIATLIDVGRTDLMTHARPAFADAELAERPALRRQLGSAAWAIFPRLRQTRYYACLALSTAGQCTLYPHWPLSCARFPYALDVGGREIFYSRRCDAFWVRPSARERATAMAAGAVAAYNETIKDFILLSYARAALQELGLAQYLRQDDAGAAVDTTTEPMGQ
ncbi:MAG: YkgJ family cysteine cluster protein [Deltaproteobacteria bacterium]|nr:YkgJ family cysteine cluster protein [Deltaproteobacteria bacterium]